MSEYQTITDHTQMRPDDLLEHRCPRFGIVTQWRVVAIHLAGEGYQSMIHVLPVTCLASEPAPFRVPEQMTRHLTIIRRSPHD